MIRSRIADVVKLLSIGCLIVVAKGALAQTPGSRADDEAAIRQAGKEYLAALERGDAKAVADFWTADGTYTDETGNTVKVHDTILKGAANAGSATAGKSESSFAHAVVRVMDRKLRFVSADVAIDEGDCEDTPPGGGAPTDGHFTALWVRQNGKWKLDNLVESRLPESGASAADTLASLDVFAGDWTGEIKQSTIHISAKWDATKKFLRRNVAVNIGKATMSGLQLIGWDPVTEHIKSWTFDDDGSHGEGLWSLEGNVWMVMASRVLPDGKTSTAVQVYKFPDKNTIVWKSIRGSIDGQPTDDFEVTFKRAAAGAAK